jgi:hypothetical protein
MLLEQRMYSAYIHMKRLATIMNLHVWAYNLVICFCT